MPSSIGLRMAGTGEPRTHLVQHVVFRHSGRRQGLPEEVCGSRSPQPFRQEPKLAIVTASTEHFITSEAEVRGRGLALRLNCVTPYAAIRLCEAALLYFPAVRQTTATRVSGGKATRSAGPLGPSTGSGAAARPSLSNSRDHPSRSR